MQPHYLTSSEKEGSMVDLQLGRRALFTNCLSPLSSQSILAVWVLRQMENKARRFNLFQLVSTNQCRWSASICLSCILTISILCSHLILHLPLSLSPPRSPATQTDGAFLLSSSWCNTSPLITFTLFSTSLCFHFEYGEILFFMLINIFETVRIRAQVWKTLQDR